MIRYILDLIYAVGQWATIGRCNNAPLLIRRVHFLKTGISANRQRQLPFKLLVNIYERRITAIYNKYQKEVEHNTK